MRKRIAIGITIVAAVAAAGAGGLLIGRGQVTQTVKYTSAAKTQADAKLQYEIGRGAGQASGEQDGYTRGYTAGTASMKKIVRGVANRSFNTGYKAAFQGFGSGWTVGDYYIVKIAPGQIGLPYELATRIQMDSASFYDQCPSGTDICTGSSADLTPTPSTPSNPTPVPKIPSVPIPPTGAGAKSLPTYPVACSDGTISPSGGHSGACSHRGGEL
jgi:hypothetical protein